ncbi:MAG: cob(I)yrinic acid a,c-diamide adenosyltransferase [candidate division Zixibacteria bacterium]
MSKNDSSIKEEGLIIVYTGNGKGKTTAALGLCVRAAGHGNKIGIIQFIKSDWEYGELKGLKQLSPEIDVQTMGAGCIGIMGDNKPLEEHKKSAGKALNAAIRAIESNKYDILIFDEINVAISLGLIKMDQVLELLKNKQAHLNIVFTGRNAPDELIEAADLVTEMKEIKHPFQKGIPARKGIDF